MKGHTLSDSPHSKLDLLGDSVLSYGNQPVPLSQYHQHSSNDLNGNQIGTPPHLKGISAFGTQSEPASHDQYVLSIDLYTM